MAAGKKASSAAAGSLTQHEGMILSVIVREQPVMAYQVYKIFERSPVTAINSSKGQLYPAIRRLKDRGLLSARQVGTKAKKAEELSVTKRGIEAARRWTKDIMDAHINLEDPLRTRVLSFDLLTKDEQIQWIAKAKALVKAKRQAVDEFNQSVSLPFQQFAYSSTMETLRIRMEWLDELLYFVTDQK